MSSRSRTFLIVGLGYAIIVVVMTLPAVAHLSDRLVGNNQDNWMFFWNDWWLERAIIEGRSPLFTPYLFYPVGTSLVTHANSFLTSLMALPLRWLVGPVPAYNIVFLLGLWQASMGMYLLVHDMTQSILAAFLAGFIFAFAPYHLTQLLGHAHLGAIQWWPFYALHLRRSLRERRLRPVFCAGAFLALTAWSGLHLALLILLWTAVYTGYSVLRRVAAESLGWRELAMVAARLALVAIVGAVLAFPILYASARELGSLVDAAAMHQKPELTQTDLVAYLMPPTYHPLFGRVVHPVYELFVANRAFMPYLGFAVLALALLAVGLRTGESWFWLGSLACWIVLAAGPALRIYGNVYHGVKLPYHYLSTMFPFSALRSPDRFNLLVAFSVAVLAGLGAARLATRVRWLPFALGAVVVVEYLCAPLPMWELPAASSYLERMAQEEPTYAIVDYPMGYTFSKYWLYFQTLHGKPMVEGHVSRYTREQYAFIAEQPFLNSLYQVAEPPPFLPSATFESSASPEVPLGPALRDLDTAGVRYILVHKSALDPESEDHLQHVLAGVPTYEDAALAVYDIRDPLPACYDGLPARIAPDIALARFDAQPLSAGGEWRIQTVAVLTGPHATSTDCRIQLVGSVGPALDVPIVLYRPAGKSWTWQQGDLDAVTVIASVPGDLRPGAYRWSVICRAGERYLAPETLTKAANGGESFLRRSVDVLYGDAIQLTGYRWRTTGADLQLILVWRAASVPQADYKVFVHLLNREGQVIGQHDAEPAEWTSPTGEWQLGELVSDHATLPLYGLAPGTYSIAVGLYDPSTMERLRALGPGGDPVPDAYFILPDGLVIASCTEAE